MRRLKGRALKAPSLRDNFKASLFSGAGAPTARNFEGAQDAAGFVGVAVAVKAEERHEAPPQHGGMGKSEVDARSARAWVRA